MAHGTAAQRRLQQEFDVLKTQAMEVQLENENILQWKVVLNAPTDCPYKDYSYTVHITFPDNWQYNAPKIHFDSGMFHPNVSETSELLISNYLPAEENPHPTSKRWSPAYSAETVLQHILAVLKQYDPYVVNIY